MNENYQRFLDANTNFNTRKSFKFYFDALDKNNIEMSSSVIIDNEHLEKVFVQLGFNSFNSVIGFRSAIKTYSVFINDKRLFNLIRKLDIYHILEMTQSNMKHTYISQSEFQDIYNAIGAYDEDSFFYNVVYYQSLFWAVYVGIYNDDMSVVKNLRISDIKEKNVILRNDEGIEWEIDIPEQLISDFITLADESVWYRKNHRGLCQIHTEGLFYDSVFKVEIRVSNSKYSYRNSYYSRLRKICEEYLGYGIAPKNLFLSGIINRIKKQYGKSDELFAESIKISDPSLVELYNQEAQRCHYSVSFWNFRQTIIGRI